MNDFSYSVVSSILHDKAAVDAIFQRYSPLLSEAGGRRIDAVPDSEASATPTFFFVLTGGTEEIVHRILAEKQVLEQRKPVLLIAHPGHNSLPAALEILAWVRQQGGKGEIVFVQSPSDGAARKRIEMLARVYSALEALARTRIGAVGAPSDWLIASSQSETSVKTSWGPELVSIPIASLQEKMKARGEVEDKNADKRVKDFVSGATGIREAKNTDMENSNSIYEGLKELAKEFSLDALTIRCFDLVTANGATGCYALSQLADDGIDAGCEGDIPSILALHSMRLLTGKAAWMANPASIHIGAKVGMKDGSESQGTGRGTGRGQLILAHCTVPRTIIDDYSIRSHFESGLGLAIAGTFGKMPVTLFRIGGKDLREAWVAEGALVASPHEDDLCRTQAVIEMDNADLGALLERPLGNHVVMAPGLWKDYALSLMSFLGIQKSI